MIIIYLTAQTWSHLQCLVLSNMLLYMFTYYFYILQHGCSLTVMSTLCFYTLLFYIFVHVMSSAVSGTWVCFNFGHRLDIYAICTKSDNPWPISLQCIVQNMYTLDCDNLYMLKTFNITCNEECKFKNICLWNVLYFL